MEVKCRICGKKQDRELMYKVIYASKTGKNTNHYYCTLEEYEFSEKEKEYYKNCQLLIDEIFEETIIDNSRNKKLVEIHTAGYTYKEIYNCIFDMKSKIENALVIKRSELDKLYNKLCYVFAIIKKEVHNYKGDKDKVNYDVEMTKLEMKRNTSVRKEKKQTRSIMDIIREGK